MERPIKKEELLSNLKSMQVPGSIRCFNRVIQHSIEFRLFSPCSENGDAVNLNALKGPEKEKKRKDSIRFKLANFTNPGTVINTEHVQTSTALQSNINSSHIIKQCQTACVDL